MGLLVLNSVSSRLHLSVQTLFFSMIHIFAEATAQSTNHVKDMKNKSRLYLFTATAHECEPDDETCITHHTSPPSSLLVRACAL